MSFEQLGSNKMKKPHIYKKWGGGWGYCVSDSYALNLAVCRFISNMNAKDISLTSSDPDWRNI
jgi:hypothetical protein